MSPLEIRILLHYSWSVVDYQQAESEGRAKSTAVRAALERLLSENLLKSRYGDKSWSIDMAASRTGEYFGSAIEHPIFAITEKGRAMVEHLCAVQIPVCKWVQPEATP
jgi:hypothetical protein